MEKLSAESFAAWLPSSDMIDHFLHEGDPDPQGRVIAMLNDGLLQAAAAQLIINGRDLGLALIPRGFWPAAANTDVWVTDRFQLSGSKGGKHWSISAYGVRIDRDIRSSSPPPPAHQASNPPPFSDKPPLPDATLEKWGEAFRAGNPNATEAIARSAITSTFPANYVSRDRLRRILPPRQRGIIRQGWPPHRPFSLSILMI